MYSTVTKVIRRCYVRRNTKDWNWALEHENNKAVVGIGGGRVGENARRGQAVALTKGYAIGEVGGILGTGDETAARGL